MHWLYNAFSSSSSSLSSSADDNYTNNRSHNRMSDVVSLFSPHRLRGTGSTNHQHINENHVVQAPLRSVSTPHILPLPDLSALSKRDSRRERAVNQKCNHILPSPENVPKKSADKRGKRIASVDRVRNTEHKELQFFHKRTQGFSIITISRDHGHKHCENVSAPTVTTESPMIRRDSNALATVATVHPLPLPPGALGLPPCSPPETTNRSDSLSEVPRESRWQKGKLIGRGTFGNVFVGSNRETGALCAMKEVEMLPDDPRSAECMKQLKQEIDVLSQLKHPNIVQYYGSEIVEDRFYIYLEYVHPGSINKYARDHCGGMTESIVRNFTRHIVSGLAYLHSTKTIHRDIKGANLLVDANGVVKLADFGMAKHLDGQVNLSLKGSPYWMAPELLQGGPQKDASPDIALAVDIWSLGCTIIEMMNGKPPWSEYEGPAAMFKVLKETPPIPETMSPDGKDFLRCCFIRNPAERPKATMLLEHKFLMVQNQREHSR